MSELARKVADAIEQASCLGREGPFGGYDYGHNEAFYGPAPEKGRYVVRDFRDPAKDTWGAWVHQTNDRLMHEEALKRMAREHIASAAIAVVFDTIESHLSAVQYDPAPYTAMKYRLAELKREALGESA